MPEFVTQHRRHFLPAAGHDLFLPLYDPLVSLLGGERARQDLIDQANIEPGHHVLDVGCGTGTLVVLLKRRYPAMQIVGLDPDRKALHRAKNKASRAGVSVQLDQGFSDELPYEQGAFDRVLSSFMFHHLEEGSMEETLREVLRVLKPVGSFHLLDFVGKHGVHGYLDRLIHSHAQLKDNSPQRILQLMKRAGLKNAEMVKEGTMFFGLLRTAYFKASS